MKPVGWITLKRGWAMFTEVDVGPREAKADG